MDHPSALIHRIGVVIIWSRQSGKFGAAGVISPIRNSNRVVIGGSTSAKSPMRSLTDFVRTPAMKIGPVGSKLGLLTLIRRWRIVRSRLGPPNSLNSSKACKLHSPQNACLLLLKDTGED